MPPPPNLMSITALAAVTPLLLTSVIVVPFQLALRLVAWALVITAAPDKEEYGMGAPPTREMVVLKLLMLEPGPGALRRIVEPFPPMVRAPKLIARLSVLVPGTGVMGFPKESLV